MSQTKDILNHPIIGERYFFPRPGRPLQSRTFTGKDGCSLVCSHRTPHPGAKTVVHFHGNGETVADYDDGYAESICALGVNLLMVEYRGYGDSQGEPRLGHMLEDVEAVRLQSELKASETILYGRSVGAIFAVEWVSQEPKVAGLILESGVADPFERLALRLSASELGVSDGELREACDAYLDHQKKLSDYHGPMLVMHAAGDTLVEPSHAQAHMSYAPTEEKKLVLFPKGGHNTVLSANWTEYLQHLQSFIDEI